MKFSIVVPVYNVRKYIDKCIDSILKQTYANYEVILVDDGSTDGSAELCDIYAHENKKIKVIHISNSGLSAARNKGISISSGEYIILLDSDDWFIDNSVLEKIANIATSDVVMFDMCEIVDGTGILKKLKLTENLRKNYSSGEIFLEDALSVNPNYRWYACIYAYKRSFWLENSFEYPVGYKYEDLGTTYKVLLKAKSVNVLNENVYAYRRLRNGSITSNIDVKAIEDRLFLEKEFEKYVLRNVHLSELKQKLLLNVSFAYYELLIKVSDIKKKKEQKYVISLIEKNKHLAKYARKYSKKYMIIYELISLIGMYNVAKLLEIRKKIRK